MKPFSQKGGGNDEEAFDRAICVADGWIHHGKH
jgi:hypothetical protein